MKARGLTCGRLMTTLFLLAALCLGGCAIREQKGGGQTMTREEMEAFLPDMPVRTAGDEEESGAVDTQTYDLEALVAQQAQVVAGEVQDGNITCTVTAPDMYTMMMDYLASGQEMTLEAYYAAAQAYLAQAECSQRVVEITVPVWEQNGELVPDPLAPEYVDAVSGGMYSALREIAGQLLQDMQALEEAEGA